MSWFEGSKAMMEGPDEVRAEKAQDEESDINVKPNVSRVAKTTVISLIAVIVAMAILVFVLATKMAGSVTAATAAAPTDDNIATTVATPTNSAVTAASTEEPIYWMDVQIDPTTMEATEGFEIGYNKNSPIYDNARELLFGMVGWCQEKNPRPFVVSTTSGNPFIVYDGEKIEVLPYADYSGAERMRELDPYIAGVYPHFVDESVEWSSVVKSDVWIEVTPSISIAWKRGIPKQRLLLVEEDGVCYVMVGENRETVFLTSCS